jgi:sugar phosphate isomerase/epimerase
MRLGVVLEAFLDRALEDILDLLAQSAPGVTDLEVGVGGLAPHPHCDVATLLEDPAARARWLDGIEGRGFRVSALNVSGNPLDPGADTARRHDAELRDAIRLAAQLGVNCVVAMAGCPAGVRGDRTAHFDAGGWLPYLKGVFESRWEAEVAPYWSALSEFARREHPALRICFELHPGTYAYNLETFERLAELGDNLAANLDPSHLFWQQMDPLAVGERLSRIGHAHAKDVVFNAGELALNGLLDHRWSPDDPNAPWTFAVVGRGHSSEWWAAFLRTLATRGVETISIEHEDPTIPAERGVADAARVLSAALGSAAALHVAGGAA